MGYSSAKLLLCSESQEKKQKLRWISDRRHSQSVVFVFHVQGVMIKGLKLRDELRSFSFLYRQYKTSSHSKTVYCKIHFTTTLLFIDLQRERERERDGKIKVCVCVCPNSVSNPILWLAPVAPLLFQD